MADLDGTIFAYDYRVRLPYVMTARQIVSCRLTHDIRTTHVDVTSVNFRVWMVESHDVC